MPTTDSYLAMQMEPPETFGQQFQTEMRDAGTGHSSDEHKKLLKVFLKFQSTIETFRNPKMINGTEWPVVEETLQFLKKYAKKSLKKEETALKLSGYPHYNLHKSSHDRFRAMIKSYEQACHEREASKVIGLKYDLYNWFIHHINGADVACRPYLNRDENSLKT